MSRGTPSVKMALGRQGQGFRTEGRLQDLKWNSVDSRGINGPSSV